MKDQINYLFVFLQKVKIFGIENLLISQIIFKHYLNSFPIYIVKKFYSVVPQFASHHLIKKYQFPVIKLPISMKSHFYLNPCNISLMVMCHLNTFIHKNEEISTYKIELKKQVFPKLSNPNIYAGIPLVFYMC